MAGSQETSPQSEGELATKTPWESVQADDAGAGVGEQSSCAVGGNGGEGSCGQEECEGIGEEEATGFAESEAGPSPLACPGVAGEGQRAVGSTGGIWTMPLMCAGIGLIACCLLIPAADVNRRLTYERTKLRMDLGHIREQVAVNGEFLKKLAVDPTLAERLAQRQMKVIREGTSVLDFWVGGGPEDASPFVLVNLAAPPAMPAYRAVGGKLAGLCRDSRWQGYLLGVGMLMVAVGLVMGGKPEDVIGER